MMLKLKYLAKFVCVVVSVSVHSVAFVVGAFYLEEKATSHWRWPILKSYVLGDVDSSKVYALGVGGFDSLPKNRWVKIHQQDESDSLYFSRQKHGGSAFDSLRGRLILFGSDTHESNWNNSLCFFDMESLRWSVSYQSDLPKTYSIDAEGVPVAGVKANHPWAMHTFGALAYDEIFDRLVVASFPGHLSPNRFGRSLGPLWNEIEHHPTWLYDLSLQQWKPSIVEVIDFFPYSIAYDSYRGVVTGFRPNGIFEWEGARDGWKKVGSNGQNQYHTNSVYDSLNRLFVLYGGSRMTNDVFTYASGEGKSIKMPTLGDRPPAGQSIPLIFNSKLGRTVALIDVEGYAQTWLYDSAQDSWLRGVAADFPYEIGMNYTMEYDEHRDVIVLVSSPLSEETAVWALRLSN